MDNLSPSSAFTQCLQNSAINSQVVPTSAKLSTRCLHHTGTAKLAPQLWHRNFGTATLAPQLLAPQILAPQNLAPQKWHRKSGTAKVAPQKFGTAKRAGSQLSSTENCLSLSPLVAELSLFENLAPQKWHLKSGTAKVAPQKCPGLRALFWALFWASSWPNGQSGQPKTWAAW